jgi:hypothetical protein
MASSTANAEGNTQEDTKIAMTPAKVKQAKEDDEHVVPHNNILLVFFALMLTAFLVRISFFFPIFASLS